MHDLGIWHRRPGGSARCAAAMRVATTTLAWIIFSTPLLVSSALAADYVVTPAPSRNAPPSEIIPGVPGPTLPVIPGDVVAKGYKRKLTKDEKRAKQLLRKAARAQGVKAPAFGSPCVTPGVTITMSESDRDDLAVITDDRTCEVRIVVAPPDSYPVPSPFAGSKIGSRFAPPADPSSVTPNSSMTSYSERTWPGQCTVPSTSSPSCGGSGYNNLGYSQAVLIDPGDGSATAQPKVVTRATAYGLWHFTRGTIKNTPIACSADTDWCWSYCADYFGDRGCPPLSNRVYEPNGQWCEEIQSGPSRQCCTGLDVTSPSDYAYCIHDIPPDCGSLYPPICYKTDPVPGHVDCYDSLSFVEGLAGDYFPPPIGQFVDTGWFPRFPSATELNVDIGRDPAWVFVGFPPPQECPAVSASGFFNTLRRSGGQGVQVHMLGFGEAGFFQRENNLVWLLLKVFGRTTNLNPLAKAFVEAALEHVRTEMPHWAMTGFGTDSQGATTTWGHCGGNTGAAPFFKKLQCIVLRPVLRGIF